MFEKAVFKLIKSMLPEPKIALYKCVTYVKNVAMSTGVINCYLNPSPSIQGFESMLFDRLIAEVFSSINIWIFYLNSKDHFVNSLKHLLNY